MTRRNLLRYLGLPAIALLAGSAYAFRRSSNPYYSGPVSDHFDGVRFFNPGRNVDKTFADMMRWQVEGGREPWPESFPSPHRDTPPAKVEGLRIVHIGHASVLYQAGGLNILVDPVFAERASPFGFAGPRRVNPPGIAFEALPKIDAVLVTHNHYDHLDTATLAALWRRDRPRILAPLGNDGIIRGEEKDLLVETLDWGGRMVLNEKVAVTLVPTYHWSARWLNDRRMALWGSFVIETPQGKVYHCGDTAYDDGEIFRAARAARGPFRLALLPIGAYEPRWFMQSNHINPDDAVKVMQDLGVPTVLGHHWGTFQLTNESIEDPPQKLAIALEQAGIGAENFTALRPGQVWEGA